MKIYKVIQVWLGQNFYLLGHSWTFLQIIYPWNYVLVNFLGSKRKRQIIHFLFMRFFGTISLLSSCFIIPDSTTIAKFWACSDFFSSVSFSMQEMKIDSQIYSTVQVRSQCWKSDWRLRTTATACLQSWRQLSSLMCHIVSKL